MEMEQSPPMNKPHHKGKNMRIHLSGLSSHCNMLDLRTFLQNYGAIKRLCLIRGTHSATLEYFEPKHAERMLYFGSIRFGDDVLSITKSNGAVTYGTYEMLKAADTALKVNPSADFYEEARVLREKFGLKTEKKTDRLEFVARLQEFVQKYFDDPIVLFPFGSTMTGLAFVDSDLDLGIKSKYSVPLSPTLDPSDLNIDDLTLERLESKKLPYSQFRSLATNDRLVLLCRIFAEYERRTAEICDVDCIFTARVPIINFKYDRVRVDLSFENLLGMRKANFLQFSTDEHPEMADLLFVIRLWGRCAGLFKDKDHPQGAWSSYAFSVFFFCYCQQLDIFGPLEDNDTFDGIAPGEKLIWKGPVPEDVFGFLKGFFEFCTKCYEQALVLTPITAEIFKLEDFHPPPTIYGRRFKISEVSNLQDPIDVCHNLTQSLKAPILERMKVKAAMVVAAFDADEMKDLGPCATIFSSLLSSCNASRPASCLADHMDMEQ